VKGNIYVYVIMRIILPMSLLILGTKLAC